MREHVLLWLSYSHPGVSPNPWGRELTHSRDSRVDGLSPDTRSVTTYTVRSVRGQSVLKMGSGDVYPLWFHNVETLRFTRTMGLWFIDTGNRRWVRGDTHPPTFLVTCPRPLSSFDPSRTTRSPDPLPVDFLTSFYRPPRWYTLVNVQGNKVVRSQHCV